MGIIEKIKDTLFTKKKEQNLASNQVRIALDPLSESTNFPILLKLIVGRDLTHGEISRLNSFIEKKIGLSYWDLVNENTLSHILDRKLTDEEKSRVGEAIKMMNSIKVWSDPRDTKLSYRSQTDGGR
jgi:hypothetical protein